MDSSNEILKHIKQSVKSKKPFAKIYLYGSRARGTANSNSDWDILILVNDEKITLELEEEISNPIYDIELSTGEVISPLIYTEKEWNSKYKISPFYKAVMNDGKLL